MSNPFIPITTADIRWYQNLPCSQQYDDIYYSIASGIQQSRYVFIDGNNLINRWSELAKDKSPVFCIGETGFGTGLNFLLTWSLWEHYAPESACLHFISCEHYPLTVSDLRRSLANWPELAPYAEQLINTRSSSFFILTKQSCSSLVL